MSYEDERRGSGGGGGVALVVAAVLGVLVLVLGLVVVGGVFLLARKPVAVAVPPAMEDEVTIQTEVSEFATADETVPEEDTVGAADSGTAAPGVSLPRGTSSAAAGQLNAPKAGRKASNSDGLRLFPGDVVVESGLLKGRILRCELRLVPSGKTFSVDFDPGTDTASCPTKGWRLERQQKTEWLGRMKGKAVTVCASLHHEERVPSGTGFRKHTQIPVWFYHYFGEHVVCSFGKDSEVRQLTFRAKHEGKRTPPKKGDAADKPTGAAPASSEEGGDLRQTTLISSEGSRRRAHDRSRT